MELRRQPLSCLELFSVLAPGRHAALSYSVGADRGSLSASALWLRYACLAELSARHHIAYADIIRSILYSVKGLKRHELAALLSFILIVALRRRLAKWIVMLFPNRGQLLWLGLRRQWARHVIKRRSSWLTLGGLLWFA